MTCRSQGLLGAIVVPSGWVQLVPRRADVVHVSLGVFHESLPDPGRVLVYALISHFTELQLTP